MGTKGEEKTSLIYQAIPTGISIAFHFFVLLIMPFVFERTEYMGLFIFTLLFFYLMGKVIGNYVSNSKTFALLDAKSKGEVENRLVSILFNISTAIPSYVGYYELLVPLLPTFVQVSQGRIWMMDYFAVWSIGYIFYDFHTLIKTYGKDSYVIQLHHVAEVVIVYSYFVENHGSLYLLAGGLMQASSGILHVSIIMKKVNYKLSPLVKNLYDWFLAFAWGHARLWEFPRSQVLCYHLHPITSLHLFCIVGGAALDSMNAMWFYKIISKKSTGFTKEEK